MNARKLLLALVVALASVGAAVLPAWASGVDRSGPTRLRIDSVRVGTKAGPLTVKVGAGLHTRLSIEVNGRRVHHPFKLVGQRAQAIDLRAGDGLRVGSNRLRVSAVREGRTSVARRTVRLSRLVLLADAGADAGTIVHVRAQLGTEPAVGGATPALSYRWRIAKRPRGASASLQGRNRPQPLLHAKTPGTYVLQLEANPDGPGPSSFDQVVVPVSPSDPPIGAPLNTIGDGGAITIGDERFGAGPSGIAYVVLERTTRHPVKSGNVPRNADGVNELVGIANEFGAAAGSTNYMKYLMIVSGRAGVPEAQADTFANFVKSIGVARLSAENFLALRVGLPFSAIGIPGAPSGAGTSRIPGGDYNPPISGAITGYLQKNQAIDADGTPLYDYVAPEHPSFDTRAPGGTDSTNKMVIDGQTYTGALPAGATAGFHVVVLESLTLRPISNQVIKTNGSGSDRTSQAEAATALDRAIEKPGGPTVFVQTIGKPKGAGPEWDGVVNQLTRLGANRQLVFALDGTTEYSLVQRLGSEQPPAEASTAYDHGPYPAPNYPPARLLGVLARTRTATFEPNVTSVPTPKSPDGAVNLALISIAYQQQRAWPQLAPGAPAGQEAAAQKYICEALNFCQAASSCPTLRDCYWQKYNSDWELKHSVLVGLNFKSGKGFEETAFNEAKAQLLPEIAQVANVRHWLTQLQEPFDKSVQRTYVDLQGISQKIWDSLQRPAADNTTSWALGLVGKVVALGGFAGPPVSAAAAGLSAAFGLASYLSNKQGQPIFGSEVKAKAATLGTELFDRVDLARKTTTGLGMLIVSDAGKLAAANQHIDSDWELPETSTATAMLQTAAKQWDYEALVPTAYPYLIRGNAPNARNFDCKLYDAAPWPRQPDSDQMSAIVGYDSNGNPVRAIFFFTLGIGGGSNPPGDIADEMFRPRGAAQPGLGIEKLSFFTPRLFGGRISHAANGTPQCQLGWLPPKY